MSTIILGDKVRFDGDRDAVIEAARAYMNGQAAKGNAVEITYRTPDCDEIAPTESPYCGPASQNPAMIMLDLARRSGFTITERVAAGLKRAAGFCDQVVNRKGLPVADIAVAEWSIGDQGRPAVKLRLRPPADERLRKIVVCHTFQLHYLVGEETKTQSGTLIEFLTIVMTLPEGAIPLSVEARFKTKGGMMSPPASRSITKAANATVNPGAAKSFSK